MKAEILNSFVLGTVEMLNAMTGIDPRRGTPRLKGADDASYDISGVIGLTGQVQGFVVMSFRESAALYVVSSFAGIGTPPTPSAVTA